MLSLPPTVASEESDRIALAIQKQKDRYKLFKKRFLGNLSKIGLLMETVCFVFDGEKQLKFLSCIKDVRESDRSLVYFIKIHIPWSLMLKYAEDLNFRAPIRV